MAISCRRSVTKYAITPYTPIAESNSALRIESRIGALQVQCAAHEQPSADEQHERERHFRDHETLTNAVATTCRRAAAFIECRTQIGRGRAQRGHEPRHDRTEQRGAGSEGQHPSIDTGLLEPRYALGAGRQKRRHPDSREENAQGGAECRQDERFGEELTQHAATARADRRAHRHPPRTESTSREKQVRDIAACDQHHQSDGAEQHEEALTVIANELPMKWLQDAETHLGIARKLLLHLTVDRPQLGGSLRLRRTGGEPSYHRQVVLVVRRHLCRRECDRRPELLGVNRDLETCRHYADDREWPRIEGNHPAHNRGIGAVASRPEPVVQDHHLIAPWDIFLGCEDAAVLRRDTEHREPRVRHASAHHALGLLVVGEIDADVLLRSQRGKRRRVRAPIGEVADRHVRRPAASLKIFADHHQPIRLGIGQRPKDDRVNHAEDRGRGPMPSAIVSPATAANPGAFAS